jgi:hypothetical protein
VLVVVGSVVVAVGGATVVIGATVVVVLDSAVVVVSAEVVFPGAGIGSEPAVWEQATRIRASPIVRTFFTSVHRPLSEEPKACSPNATKSSPRLADHDFAFDKPHRLFYANC